MQAHHRKRSLNGRFGPQGPCDLTRYEQVGASDRFRCMKIPVYCGVSLLNSGVWRSVSKRASRRATDFVCKRILGGDKARLQEEVEPLG